MQYLNHENFIYALRKRFLGGMHKVIRERQMFFRQNHALRFRKKINKILVYNRTTMGCYCPGFFVRGKDVPS